MFIKFFLTAWELLSNPVKFMQAVQEVIKNHPLIVGIGSHRVEIFVVLIGLGLILLVYLFLYHLLINLIHSAVSSQVNTVLNLSGAAYGK